MTNRLFKLANELKTKSITEDAKKLANLVSEISLSFLKLIKIRKEYLDFISSEQSDDSELIETNIVTNLRRIGQVAEILLNLLQFVQQTKEENLPFLIPSIRNILNQFEDDIGLVITPIWEYNYKFIELAVWLRDELAPLNVAEIDTALSDFPNFFIILEYPISEKKSVLIHSVLAHEVGHFIDKQKGISNQLLSEIELDKDKLEELTEEYLKEHFSLQATSPQDSEVTITLDMFLDRTIVKNRLREEVMKKLNDWICELVSDAIGCTLFGPAYFFSLVNLIISRTDPHSNEHIIGISKWQHPPPDIRLRAIISQLERSGFLEESLEEISNILRAMKSELSSEPDLSGLSKFISQLYSLLCESIDSIRESLLTLVHTELTQLAFTPELFEEEVFSLADRIVELLPPGELVLQKNKTVKSVSEISIINAGHLVQISRIEDVHQEIKADDFFKKVEAFDILNQLVNKGLEIQNVKKQLNGSN